MLPAPQSHQIQSQDGETRESCVGEVCCLVAQSCLTLCDSMDCSPPGSSVPGILQARTLEWVATASSRGSSDPRSKPPSPALLALLYRWSPGEQLTLPPGCTHLRVWGVFSELWRSNAHTVTAANKTVSFIQSLRNQILNVIPPRNGHFIMKGV